MISALKEKILKFLPKVGYYISSDSVYDEKSKKKLSDILDSGGYDKEFEDAIVIDLGRVSTIYSSFDHGDVIFTRFNVLDPNVAHSEDEFFNNKYRFTELISHFPIIFKCTDEDDMEYVVKSKFCRYMPVSENSYFIYGDTFYCYGDGSPENGVELVLANFKTNIMFCKDFVIPDTPNTINVRLQDYNDYVLFAVASVIKKFTTIAAANENEQLLAASVMDLNVDCEVNDIYDVVANFGDAYDISQEIMLSAAIILNGVTYTAILKHSEDSLE